MKWTIVMIIIIVAVGLGYYFYTKKYPSSNTDTGIQTSTSTKTDQIVIKDFAFNPSSITVKIGDTVTFTNDDSVTHTVAGDGGIDSRDLATGESYKETFNTAGTFNYHCTIHPTMKGMVVVQ